MNRPNSTTIEFLDLAIFLIRFLKLQFALLAELVYVADYSSEDEEESVYETLSDSVCNISVATFYVIK